VGGSSPSDSPVFVVFVVQQTTVLLPGVCRQLHKLHGFYKYAPCYFAFLVGLGVYLMHIQIYCCKLYHDAVTGFAAIN
jgi:hypothetical protein